MLELVALGSVFLIGIFELWAAIPVGLAAGLSPLVVGVVTSAGAVAGVVLVAYSGEGLRRWLEKKYKPKEAVPGTEPKESTGAKIWKKSGVVGLGLLAPALTGAFAGAALAILLGADRKSVVLWTGLGAVIWTIVLTAAAAWGASALFGHEVSLG